MVNIHNPSIEVHLAPPEKAKGMAVIVAAGGGNQTCNVGPEGTAIAEWLNGLGVHAFIERYRLRPYSSTTDVLADTQRCFRVVRANAREWGVDPKHIGIMGFSAGGEQSARVALNFDEGKSDASDPIERFSCRPDFTVLVYAGWRRMDLSDVPKKRLRPSWSARDSTTRSMPDKRSSSTRRTSRPRSPSSSTSTAMAVTAAGSGREKASPSGPGTSASSNGQETRGSCRRPARIEPRAPGRLTLEEPAPSKVSRIGAESRRIVIGKRRGHRTTLLLRRYLLLRFHQPKFAGKNCSSHEVDKGTGRGRQFAIAGEDEIDVDRRQCPIGE